MLLFRDVEQQKRLSFYVRHGDWFLWLSAGLIMLAVVLLRITPDLKESEPESEDDEGPSTNIFERRRRLKSR